MPTQSLLILFAIQLALLLLPRGAYSQAPPATASTATANPTEASGQHWAIIVVGLPGDPDYSQLYAATAQAWQQWLRKLGLADDHVLLLENASGGPPTDDVTRDHIAQAFTGLQAHVQAGDTLWVFFLGHANYDEGRAAFHVRGPDPDDAEIAGWLDGIRCQQQIVWLTHSCSGWFVKRLSAPARIVIAATAADQEPNETEFPLALATVCAAEPATLDENGDQRISILELFAASVRETARRYQQDKRVPTEHAQLDDNGDGRGTELDQIQLQPAVAGDVPAGAAVTPSPAEKRDGEIASSTYLPLSMIPVDNQPQHTDP